MSTLFVNNLNTASGTNITVPTGKKLIVTDAGALTAPGMILQTVRSEFRTYTSFDSTSFANSGLTGTITPKFSSSKILVTVIANGIFHNGSAKYMFLNLYRGSSSIASLDNGVGYNTSGDEINYGIHSNVYQHEDSPSTTSATTYALYWKKSDTGQTAGINNYNSVNGSTLSTITLQEIAQ